MARKFLWICESCGDTTTTDRDERPIGWRTFHLSAEGEFARSYNDKTVWMDGVRCQACFFALDEALRRYADERRNPPKVANDDGGRKP